MKNKSIVVLSALSVLAINACGRLEPSQQEQEEQDEQIEQQEQIDIAYFWGAWQEYFGPDFHVEGSRIWYISKEVIGVRTYNWYTDTVTEKNLQYSLEQKEGKYIVVLHIEEGWEAGDQSYYIIKLTDEEMIWQRVDNEKIHQHFVNSKFWQSHPEY